MAAARVVAVATTAAVSRAGGGHGRQRETAVVEGDPAWGAAGAGLGKAGVALPRPEVNQCGPAVQVLMVGQPGQGAQSHCQLALAPVVQQPTQLVPRPAGPVLAPVFPVFELTIFCLVAQRVEGEAVRTGRERGGARQQLALYGVGDTVTLPAGAGAGAGRPCPAGRPAAGPRTAQLGRTGSEVVF